MNGITKKKYRQKAFSKNDMSHLQRLMIKTITLRTVSINFRRVLLHTARWHVP